MKLKDFACVLSLKFFCLELNHAAQYMVEKKLKSLRISNFDRNSSHWYPSLKKVLYIVTIDTNSSH